MRVTEESLSGGKSEWIYVLIEKEKAEGKCLHIRRR